jgi:hypothetical protein
LSSDDDWLLKIIAIENRFVLGLYRRQMKTISYLGKIEKLLGVPTLYNNYSISSICPDTTAPASSLFSASPTKSIMFEAETIRLSPGSPAC